ncbi:relaxase domain-containing protein [Curtobacterium sp. L1-20]|uniref:relaxase domain-containing protein n=1 Tax=Curtobacterium sp. L1-20 TaxID=3138181 RepID=UPI003B527824
MFEIRTMRLSKFAQGCPTPLAATAEGTWVGGVPAGVDPSQPVSRAVFQDIATRMTDPISASPELLEVAFEVPLSVSVLWATQADEIRALLSESVLGAVDDTMRTLGSEWIFARRGERGIAQIDIVEPAVACAFMHHFDRQGKPGIHVHVDVVNAVLGSDRRVTGMDVTTIRSAEEVAHERYVSSLIAALDDRLSVAVDISYREDRRSHFEVAGVDPALIWDLPRVPQTPAVQAPEDAGEQSQRGRLRDLFRRRPS